MWIFPHRQVMDYIIPRGLDGIDHGGAASSPLLAITRLCSTLDMAAIPRYSASEGATGERRRYAGFTA